MSIKANKEYLQKLILMEINTKNRFLKEKEEVDSEEQAVQRTITVEIKNAMERVKQMIINIPPARIEAVRQAIRNFETAVENLQFDPEEINRGREYEEPQPEDLQQ